jgi:prepilin-type N-terminal cleavage/methylation domain-containing protein
MRRRDPRAGLTLLELLLALSVMAGLAVAAATTLGITARAIDWSARGGPEVERLQARATLRRWIEAMPPDALLAGDAAQLRFQTFVEGEGFGPGVLALVEVAATPDGVTALARLPEAPEGPSLRLTLSETGDGMGLRYYGQPGAGAPAWTESWPRPDMLPLLLRLDYRLSEGPAPPLTARPALTARQSEISLSSLLPPG